MGGRERELVTHTATFVCVCSNSKHAPMHGVHNVCVCVCLYHY